MKTLFTHPFRRQYHWGYLAVGCTLLVSYALWLGSMWYYQDWYENPWKYMAKVGSHSATLLMCWAFILATRFRPVEVLFGGLDKVYKSHRYIGEIAFFLIFLHPLGLALMHASEGGSFWAYLWFSGDWVRNTGIIALAGFALLVVLSIYVKIRYHRWKRTHDFFGLLLLLIIVHGIMAKGEIVAYPLLGLWFALWCGLGLAAYVYIRLLYRWLGPQYDHVVDEVRQVGDAVVELYLKPQGRAMVHEPGQFVYISLDANAVSREPHPFSISSAPDSPRLRLSIKQLGDWTQSVHAIQAGEQARVWGPYGHFSETIVQGSCRQRLIFLGGGIGITPFLSMLASERMRKAPYACWMIYSVADAQRAVYSEELRTACAQRDDWHCIQHLSDEEGFINADYLQQHLGSLNDCTFYICGPQVMMDSVSNLLLDAGVPIEHIISEDFDIR
ncbi:MAG: hypothetical protein EA401_12245 [Planctomycetota bacterium]|nr:MAG: hypothetical protein EA401_12245 [Planctomycetota bacterium]